jgi:replicative DNA helicase
MSDHENAIIGAAILDPTTLDTTAAVIGPQDFADAALGRVFALMIDMHGAGLPIGDHAVLVPRLRAVKLLERIGGVSGIAAIVASVPNVRHCRQYAEAVLSDATRRRLASMAVELATRSADPAVSPAEIVSWCESQLTRHRSGSQEATETLADAMRGAINDIEAIRRRERVAGLSTGLAVLDSSLGGLFPGELVILAARPSIGKSALGVQIGLSNAEAGRAVLFVSLEMSSRDIATRQLASRLGYENRVLRNGLLDDDDIRAAQGHAEALDAVPFHILSSRSASMAKIRAAARVQLVTTGLALLVVDYLGLVAATDRRKPRWEQVTEISGDLKSLALELNVPVLALCQLNRDAEKGRPTLAHLRDAGAIEQDADVVLLLHRESRDSDRATIDVAKCRNGSTGAVDVGFDCGRVEFVDAVDAYSKFT